MREVFLVCRGKEAKLWGMYVGAHVSHSQENTQSIDLLYVTCHSELHAHCYDLYATSFLRLLTCYVCRLPTKEKPAPFYPPKNITP